ncbi:right-handed parallel beta-helix repeat-containing protein [Flavobacterium sp. FlaQc-48]|uniref:right-handed parallel beta-helix repeat-containing protein n=1 Tax=Flavobacterium sp. FlaQc-48 TaxID=3374181 RepID=UPI00375746B7
MMINILSKQCRVIYGSLVLFFSILNSASAQHNSYYVSLKGNDKNNGTITAPFKTIEKALEKVGQSKSKSVAIYIRSGRYHLKRTIEITPAVLKDHFLTLSGYQNEKVVLTGAIPVETVWQPYKGKILRASIGEGKSVDQFYVNKEVMPQARYPNFDSNARVYNGTASDAFSKDRVSKWANPKGGYIHALHQGEWGDFHYQIKGKDNKGELLLEGGWQNNRPSKMHNKYRFVENIFEELDAPGEWYYNADEGNLYFYPPEGTNFASALTEISVLDQIITISGTAKDPAKNVLISNLVFTGTNRTFMLTKEPLLRSDWRIYRGGAILIKGGKNVNVEKCEFENLGGNAVFVSGFNRQVAIKHNYIHQIGGNAIAFVGDTSAVRSASFKYEAFVPVPQMDMRPGPKNDLYPKDCSAEDNLIHAIGKIEKQVAGIEISMSMNIQVSHNTIYDVPRAGINVGDGCWGGHLIEYNDVFDSVKETGDHGAFNSWGRDRFWLPAVSAVDSLVEKNPGIQFLDVIEPITLRNNRFYCAHGWDIDLDDGSTNYKIYNNVCLNGGLKLREGYSRIVENNVLVNNTFHPHAWYKSSKDVFKHNIVTSGYAPVRINDWGTDVDNNFFIQKAGLLGAQARGTDLNSRSGDPLFVDEKNGLYNVKPGSGALSIGFKNFPMDNFGVTSKSLKAKAARPFISGIKLLEPEKAGEIVFWNGASIKNVESLGEQSAAGLLDRDGILIIKVEAESLAYKSGLREGDVIRSVNTNPVLNVKDLIVAVQQVMWKGKTMASIWRNQQPAELTLILK